MKNFRLLLSLMVCVLGVLTPFLLLEYSLHYSDEPYQLMNAMDYINNPVAFGSSFLSGLWGKLFGFELIRMRLFMAICSTLTMALGVLFFYLKTHNKICSLFMMGALSALMAMNQVSSYTVGWDVVSNLFLVFSLLLLVVYMDKIVHSRSPKLPIFLLSISSALLFLCRLPSGIFVAIAVVSLSMARQSWRHKICIVAMYIVMFLIFTFTAIILAYGSIDSFLLHLKEYFTQGIGREHSPFRLFFDYLDGFNGLLKFVPTILVLYILINKALKTGNTIIWYSVVGVASIVIYVLLYLNDNGRNWSFIQMMTSVLVLLLILCFKRNDRKSRIMALIVAMVAFVPNFGTNCGLNKIMSVPLFAILLVDVYKDRTLRVFGISLGLSLMLYLPANKMHYLWFDEGVLGCNSELQYQYVNGIKTNEKSAHSIDVGCELMRKYDKSIMVGPGHQLFELIFSRRYEPTRHYFFSFYDDPGYVDRLVSSLPQCRCPVVAIDSRRKDILIKGLSSIGYEIIENVDGYIVFDIPH